MKLNEHLILNNKRHSRNTRYSSINAVCPIYNICSRAIVHLSQSQSVSISISSGSTVMLRASASLITTSSVLSRHLVVFHGFPRNFSENVALSCQAHLRNARFPHANSDQFSRSLFIVFSRYIPKAIEIQVESKGVCTLRLAAPSPRKSTRFIRKTQTKN